MLFHLLIFLALHNSQIILLEGMPTQKYRRELQGMLYSYMWQAQSAVLSAAGGAVGCILHGALLAP